MSNQAQTQQVFVYIIAAIVIGLMFLFGYKALAGLFQAGSEAEETKFVNEFTTAVDTHSSFNKVDTLNLRLPMDYTILCLRGHKRGSDDDLDGLYVITQAETTTYPFVDEELRNANSNKNVFLVNEENAVKALTVDPLEVLEIDASGNAVVKLWACQQFLNQKVNLRTRGRGDATALEFI
jgi:hypothetical protein